MRSSCLKDISSSFPSSKPKIVLTDDQKSDITLVSQDDEVGNLYEYKFILLPITFDS